ncbi:MAG: hypothetical protein JWR24_3321, partial [Actinoallomurus sp.]|nr:hypothetical protein [Actinoallomurus sp.]
ARSVRPGAVAVPAGEDDGNGGQVAHWRRIWASTQPLDDKRRRVWKA